MIKLILNSNIIWLDPDTRIRLEINSTLFQTDVIPGSIVYPFNIPVAENEETFDHAHYIEVNRLIKSYSITMIICDSIHFSCKLLLKKISNKYYRSSIIINTFSTALKDTKLKQLQYDDILIGGATHSNTNVAFHAEQVVKGNVDADYTFPVLFSDEWYGDLDEDSGKAEFNPDWGGDDGTGAAGKIINNWNASAGTFPINSIHQDPLCDNVRSLLPCPFLVPVIQKIFSDENYYLFGDFISDQEINDLIFFNNYPIDEKYKKFYVRASQTIYQNVSGLETIIFPNDSTNNNEDNDNIFDTTLSEYTISNIGYHSINVELDFSNSGSGTQNETNIQVSIDSAIVNIVTNTQSAGHISLNYIIFAENSDLTKKIKINAEFKDYDGSWDYCEGIVSSGVLTITNTSFVNLNQYSNKMNIANHLPDIEINSFINTIRKAFGLAIFYDFSSREIEFSFAKDLLSSTGYIDLSSLVLANVSELEMLNNDGYVFSLDYHREVTLFDNYEYLGEFNTYTDLVKNAGYKVNTIALVKNTNVIYIYRNDHDTNEIGWKYFSDNFYSITDGNGETPIKPKLSTLAMGSAFDMLSCQTKITSSSPAFETGMNDLPFILAFYRGMQPDKENNDYPMASCVNLDIEGNSIGNYTMAMNGEDGLYNTFLKPWYDFINSAEKLTKRFDCDVDDMINILKLFQPQRGRKVRKCRVENINYIPSKFSFIINMNSIEQVEGVLYKEGGKQL